MELINIKSSIWNLLKLLERIIKIESKFNRKIRMDSLWTQTTIIFIWHLTVVQDIKRIHLIIGIVTVHFVWLIFTLHKRIILPQTLLLHAESFQYSRVQDILLSVLAWTYFKTEMNALQLIIHKQIKYAF